MWKRCLQSVQGQPGRSVTPSFHPVSLPFIAYTQSSPPTPLQVRLLLPPPPHRNSKAGPSTPCKPTRSSQASRTRPGPRRRPGDGAPARPATRPTSTDSGVLAKPRNLEREYRGGETKALNGDLGAWPASHSRSGAEDPLPACSEAPRMGGLGEMLVDPSEQPLQP